MKRIALLAALALAAGGVWRVARACAPDFYRAVFTYVRHPDLTRGAFVDGRLGVMQPTFRCYRRCPPAGRSLTRRAPRFGRAHAAGRRRRFAQRLMAVDGRGHSAGRPPT